MKVLNTYCSVGRSLSRTDRDYSIKSKASDKNLTRFINLHTRSIKDILRYSKIGYRSYVYYRNREGCLKLSIISYGGWKTY